MKELNTNMKANHPLNIIIMCFSLLIVTICCGRNINKKDVIKIEWCKIPAGSFLMGRSTGERETCEEPLHQVYLNEFFISKYEVTVSLYERFCDETGRKKPNKHYYDSNEYPIDDVSWNEAIDFCHWISQKNGYTISLPTEAQWEKAARGGTVGENYVYESDDLLVEGRTAHPTELLEQYEWFGFNSGGDIHVVGGKKPNPYGLYDILGNVSEWCFDLYDNDYYKKGDKYNPKGPKWNDSGCRVIRGGDFSNDNKALRCSYRRAAMPDFKGVGFRLVKLGSSGAKEK